MACDPEERKKMKHFLFLVALITTLPQPGQGEYTMGAQLIQPLKPEPGDVVVFKVTLANEPRWSRVLKARVVSPDGVVYELAGIRYVDRPGSTIIHEEYLTWQVPEDAPRGNYTLEVNTPENVFLSTTFRVFRHPKLIYEDGVVKNVGTAPARATEARAKACEECPSGFYQYLGNIEAGEELRLRPPRGNFTVLQLSYRYDRVYSESFPIDRERHELIVSTRYENGSFTVTVGGDLSAEIEVLREIPVRVRESRSGHETRFIPVKFRLQGQSYAYGEKAVFHIIPDDDYIEIPVRIRARNMEKLVIWSGRVGRKKAEQPMVQPEKEAPEYRLIALGALVVLALAGSSYAWLRRRAS